MSDLRKLVASAILGTDLSDDPNQETPLDRIAAFAFSDRLGNLLWRLRWANDRHSFAPAVFLLSSRMRVHGELRSMREKVAQCALMEWLNDVCVPCQGRGKLVPKDTPIATHSCTVCNGTGKARHSDAARARALGLEVGAVRKWEHRFERAHAKISSADALAWVEVAAQLGRVTRKEKGLEQANRGEKIGVDS